MRDSVLTSESMRSHFGLSSMLLLGLTGSLACAGDHIGLDPRPADPQPYPVIAPAQSHLPRLTRVQYENTLRDVFGEEIALPSRLEPDVAIDGLIAIGATQTSVSSRGAEQYETAAYDIAKQAMEPGAARDVLVPCQPGGTTDDSCARAVLSMLGRRLWRRPLAQSELDALVALAAQSASTLGDFYDGLEFGIAMVLQSPHFLFRAELGEPDPDASGQLRYSSYQMASRLSFFLWNTAPDEELLDAAERGELVDDASLRAHAERMVAAPQARHALRNFFSDLFELYELDELNKDPAVFTHMSPELGEFAREETLHLLEDQIFDERGDYRDLFTTRKTFLNRKLAAVYGVPAPAPEGFAAFYWPADTERSGILTHISILAGNSHPIASSATLRGKFVRKRLLCGIISPPPTEVNTALPEPSGTTRTLRERVAEHLTNPICAGCHSNMDPVGLGLENFDALGQFRRTDNDAAIDPSGELDGVAFANPRQLGQVIANHPSLPDCLVANLYRYATGHMESFDEKPLLNHLEERFALREYRVLDLLVDIVMSPGFRRASVTTDEGAE